MFYGKVLCILGPTCVGKTKISLDLSTVLTIEIINVDSCMIYKNMDIGTDKPHHIKLYKTKHHLINILDPKEKYSVNQFSLDSLHIIKNCWKNNKLPTFVGGNLMYMWFFQNIFVKNKINIKFINIGIIPTNKLTLKIEIQNRLKIMLKNNFINEVYFLHNRSDLNITLNSINCIGYKEIWSYLDNKITLNEAVLIILNNTLNLANKQLLWLKNWNTNIFYFDSKKKHIYSKIKNLVNHYL